MQKIEWRRQSAKRTECRICLQKTEAATERVKKLENRPQSATSRVENRGLRKSSSVLACTVIGTPHSKGSDGQGMISSTNKH